MAVVSVTTVPAAPALPEEQEPDDEAALVDILAGGSPTRNGTVTVPLPLPPLPPLDDPETQKYLSHLTTLPLTTLLEEPTALRTQSHHLTSSLTALTHASYPTFLSLHHASTSLSASLSSLSTSLDSLLRESLPKLDESLGGWGERTDGVLRERRKARVVLEQHDKIRDLLDIPLLIDTCVRNGYFAEALSLASHASSVSSSLSSLSTTTTTTTTTTTNTPTTTRAPAILHSIRAEVHHSITQMLLTLLTTLHEPNRKLPALWKAVTFLRKMDVFDDEDQIALAFLGGREGCLKASLDGCGRDVQALILAATGEGSGGGGGGGHLGEREREDIAKYLRRYIDLWREGVYDIVTQYTTIFLERPPSSLASSPKSIPSPSSSSSSSSPSHHPTPTLHTLLTTYASHALSTHLLPPLKALLPLVPSAYSSLLTQLTYCATAFARVGMDFRGLLGGLFCDAVQKSVGRELKDAGVKWAARVRGAANGGGGGTGKSTGTLPTPPSRWLLTTSTHISTPPTPPASYSPASAPIHIPPPILASYPPLADFTNALLGSFNALRMLAPVGVMGELLDVLENVLAEGLLVLLGYTRDISGKRPIVESSGDGGTTQGEDAVVEVEVEMEERVVRAAGDVYVRVFVPYMRRALVEGVYGVKVGVEFELVGGGGEPERQSELGKAVREWEGWLMESRW